MSDTNPQQLPEDLEILYLNLWEEVCWLHVVWNQYCRLFRTSPEQLNLLNEMVGAFIRVCHDSLLDDVVLSLCRLTDPPSNRHQQNLSLKLIADEVRAHGNAALTAAVGKHEAEAKARCEILRKHRDKRIAHSDLEVSLSNAHLAGVTPEMIEKALESVRDFANAIGEYSEGMATQFQIEGAQPGEANDLVYCLKEAKAYRKHQMAGRVNPIEDGIRKK